MNNIVVIHRLELDPYQVEYEVPDDIKFLHAGVKHDKINVWYTTNPDNKKTKTIQLYVIATGIEFNDTYLTYLSTVIMHNGDLVFHIFYNPYGE